MVGELLQALQDSGRAGDTAIVFCGDNGFHLGQKLHWRKFVLWEEATRVPLVIVPPGETRGQVVDAPVSLVDIYPTIAQLCGLPMPEGIDGHSLVPLMRSAASERPAPPVMTWLRGNHSVRDARWRYTRYSDGTEELYDRIADPMEWVNLAASPGLAGVKAEFARQLPVEG
jgi:arylsulfatase A-like enzyme